MVEIDTGRLKEQYPNSQAWRCICESLRREYVALLPELPMYTRKELQKRKDHFESLFAIFLMMPEIKRVWKLFGDEAYEEYENPRSSTRHWPNT